MNAHRRRQRRTAMILSALALAFAARVLGQAVVAVAAPGWLPPMDAWYSGLLPYPLLLPAQLAILALQARVSADLWRGRGRFAGTHARIGVAMRGTSYLYFAGMALRYVLTMLWAPERRWLGGTIPIFFHFVLAAYLYAWSRYLSTPQADEDARA